MLKFIDLFCGIGGFRISLEKIQAKCVFSCDINEHARDMYNKNFNDVPHHDITKVIPEDIPDFDILCAGFPCQSFSSAGKKLGFNDDRGNLFFEICRIVNIKQPKVLFLENVKNLLSHDKGNTFQIIKDSIENMGYELSYEILSAKDFGVPQNRESIILIAIRKDLNKKFNFSSIKKNQSLPLIHFLDETKDIPINHYLTPSEYTLLEKSQRKTQEKSGLIFCGYRNKKTRQKGILENSLHLSRTHKQCNRIYSSTGMHPTLSSQESSGRYFIYLENETNPNKQVRKLTINECYRIMGFPDDFIKVAPVTKLYERIGNSVSVTMMTAIAEEIKKQIFN